MTDAAASNASACTKQFLPSRFQPCAVDIDYNNSSAAEVADCFMQAMRNSSIEACTNQSSSSDPVQRFQLTVQCLKEAKREFKVSALTLQ